MKPEYFDRLSPNEKEYYEEVYKDSERWNGVESLVGKTIIVYCEQGMGDIIQFSRYFPFLKQKMARIILHCPLGLHRLMSCINGVDEIIDRQDPHLPPHDLHTMSMSLPFVLNDPQTSFPYINFTPDIDSLEFTPEQKNNIKIGIAWEGNPHHSDNEIRSCSLKYFRLIHNLPVQLFMLQNRIYSPKLIEGCEDMQLFGADIDDFYDTATLISAMDLVISVDTSVLHLAGALNKTTFGLLSETGDYRWKISNWYDSLTLLRQQRAGDWKSVFEHPKLINHLNSLVNQV